MKHLTSHSEYINPATQKCLDKLSVETKNVNLIQLMTAWQKVDDMLVGRL